MIVDGHTHIIPSLDSTALTAIKFDWSDLEQWLSSEPNSRCVIIPKIDQFSDSVSLNIEFFERVMTFRQRRRVFPFLWVHPQQLVEEHFSKFNFSGVKFHPSISQMTLTENEDMLNWCEKYEKPLLIHCGRDEKSRIDYVLKVNEDYPRLKFICAHMGGLATDLVVRAYERISHSRYLDNIYLDTSGCFYPKLIEKAVELLGNDKILFGTDRPFHSYEMSLYAVNSCGLGIEDKEKILSHNVLDLLQRVQEE